jgi:2-methylcitrate dehydratase
MDTTTRRICDYVVARRDTPLSDGALRAVRLHLTDTLACAAGGSDSPPARIAAHVARSAAGLPGSRVWFDGTESSVDLAAFANGVMVRYLDYNDAGGGGHPSDTAAALIALADAYHLPGSALATGLVIAYDVMKAAGPSLAARDHGFDQGIAVGAAVATAAAALLGGDHAAIANALALVIVPYVPLHQTRVGELSMWKGAATSAAARSGLFAAQLAVAGMTGPAEPFEGKDGLFNRVTGPYEALLPDRLSEPGTTAIEQAHYKLRPAEFQSQAALDVIEEVAAVLAEQASAGSVTQEQARSAVASQIARIDIQTYAFAYTEIADPDKWRPANRETADHSMPFLIASTLRHGRVSAAHFSEERIADPDTRALMDRIFISENPEFSALYPPVMRTQLDFTLVNGLVISKVTGYPRGHAANPATEADIEAKFRAECGRIAPAAWVDRALGVVTDVAALPDCAALVDTFTSEYAAAAGPGAPAAAATSS